MANLGSVDLSFKRNRMFLFIGPKFSGKSVGAASWKYKTQGKSVRLYDFDGRIDSIAKHYAGEEGVNWDSVAPQNMAAILQEINGLKNNCPYSAIIFDSISSMSMTLVNYGMILRGIAIGEVGRTKSGQQGLLTPGWDEVNGETTAVSQILDICKLLPCDVIFTAHPVKRTETTGTGSDMVVSKTTGIVSFGFKLQSIIPVYFTEVWDFRTETNPVFNGPPFRKILTQGDGDTIANTALPLPREIDWTGKKLYPYLQELIANAQPTTQPANIPPTN